MNLQNMKSYVSIDSERSMASAGVSGTASGDRSDSILSLEGKLVRKEQMSVLCYCADCFIIVESVDFNSRMQCFSVCWTWFGLMPFQ